MASLFEKRRFAAVLHFAAHVSVEESVRDPAKYYRNNTVNALGLFGLAARHGVASLVFSSTAAVYGEPPTARVDETTSLAPINPYGASKMMAERMLRTSPAPWACATRSCVISMSPAPTLRRAIGQATPGSGHLIKVACATALGQRSHVSIHGTDYPTPDGTCVRDYIHVDDLAQAHLNALDYLERGGASTVLNCGYGHGHSVREVIEAVRRASGVDFPIREGPRRPGDPLSTGGQQSEDRGRAGLAAPARRPRVHRAHGLALGAEAAGARRAGRVRCRPRRASAIVTLGLLDRSVRAHAQSLPKRCGRTGATADQGECHCRRRTPARLNFDARSPLRGRRQRTAGAK